MYRESETHRSDRHGNGASPGGYPQGRMGRNSQSCDRLRPTIINGLAGPMPNPSSCRGLHSVFAVVSYKGERCYKVQSLIQMQLASFLSLGSYPLDVERQPLDGDAGGPRGEASAEP
jgi:hypothetical protein